ncbi:class I SAM-dependent methyltransferase [Phyllobacterium sp. 21LDTY02-6]|uniref:class I SAM-dependent methyltransferase n=1 Tax=Phyllobacterium sp. 21LDTY02-6 TaxID=2944903 RepID=UPI002020F094|nr:class I SAM-dependent methyltransferase [Phyllobacterium sp. 21LDTY02-6]MCO4319643.1 class I SAM-dependent methyltransferase [Phyllobacterium sp. 21LDTY02-6]
MLKQVGNAASSEAASKQDPDRLAEAWKLVWANIHGWVGDRIIQILQFTREYHDEMDIRGSIGEIGVHHGKLFFLLASLARADEDCVAIDLYENQVKNLDHSGKGSLEIFTGHLDTLFPQMKRQVKAVAADSMSLTPSNVRDKLGVDKMRLFSVDGGHTIMHVVNDLSIAQELIVPGGIIMLDDFLGPLWPTVTEGYFEYMRTANRRLVPFLSFQNKLFLTTYSEGPEVLAKLRSSLDRMVGKEIHSGKWRYSTLNGHQILCFAR